MKRIGPKTEPWGTQQLNSVSFNKPFFQIKERDIFTVQNDLLLTAETIPLMHHLYDQYAILTSRTLLNKMWHHVKQLIHHLVSIIKWGRINMLNGIIHQYNLVCFHSKSSEPTKPDDWHWLCISCSSPYMNMKTSELAQRRSTEDLQESPLNGDEK